MRRKIQILVGIILSVSCSLVSAANTPEEIQKYIDGAKKGSIPAAMLMADAYQHGDGVTRNLVKARQYYEIAAKGGEPVGQTILATMYVSGEGGPKDLGQTVYWLRQSAMQNHPEALLLLANMVRDGNGVKEDSRGAYNLLLRCAIHKISEGSYINPTPLMCRVMIADNELKSATPGNQAALRKAMLFLALTFDDPYAQEAQRADKKYIQIIETARTEYQKDAQYLTPDSVQYLKDNLAARQVLFDSTIRTLETPEILKR